MDLMLLRQYWPEYTEGSLLVDMKAFCLTLEDQRRDISALDCSAKVPGETCIPEGTYPIKVVERHGHRDVWGIWLQNVPCFTGILIHPGNTPKDSEGCILVGYERGDNGTLRASRAAWDALLSLMQEAHRRGERITIEITS